MRRGTINSHEFVFCMVEKKKCYSGTTRLSVKSHVIVLDLLHFSRRRKFAQDPGLWENIILIIYI